MDIEIPLLRIKRAQAQLDTLKDELDRYTDRSQGETHTIVPEGDDDPNVQHFRFFLRRVPPRIIGVLIGECVHNLRAALDNLFFTYAGPHVSKRTLREIDFPICVERDVFEAKAASNFKNLPAKGLGLLRSVQPYRREYEGRRWNDRWRDPHAHPLAMLQRISNSDKHRIPVIALINIVETSIAVSTGKAPRVMRANGCLDDGAIAARLDFSDSEPDIHIQAALTFGIALDEWGPISGMPLTEVLIGIHQYIDLAVVGEFGKL